MALLVDDVKRLKVNELREELAKRGADTSGLKKDLVERLEGLLGSQHQGVPFAGAMAATPGGAGPATTSSMAAAPAAGLGSVGSGGRQHRAPIVFEPQPAPTPQRAASPPSTTQAAKPSSAGTAGTGTAGAADPPSSRQPVPVPGKLEEDKKSARAARFGIQSEAAKAEQRAKRFGLSSGSGLGGATDASAAPPPIVKPVLSEEERKAEQEKKAARAKRYGLPQKANEEEESLKKKARLDRFGPLSAGSLSSGGGADRAAAKAASGKAFAAAGSGGLGVKALSAAQSEATRAKKEARAARFAVNA